MSKKTNLNGSLNDFGKAFGNVITEALQPVNEKLDALQKQNESTQADVNVLLEWIAEQDGKKSSGKASARK